MKTFRRLSKSKVGIAILFVFLGLIVLSFAAADIQMEASMKSASIAGICPAFSARSSKLPIACASGPIFAVKRAIAGPPG